MKTDQELTTKEKYEILKNICGTLERVGQNIIDGDHECRLDPVDVVKKGILKIEAYFIKKEKETT